MPWLRQGDAHSFKPSYLLKMIWLIEEYDLFDGSIKALAAEAKEQGHTVDLMPYQKMQYDNTLPKGYGEHPSEACVLFYGSIEQGRWIQQNRQWVPGCWSNWERYRCSRYYAVLGKHLFNSDYLFLPYAEVKRRREELILTLGAGNGLFIRPDDGAKSFTGTTLGGDAETGGWNEHAWKSLDKFVAPDTLCVVAEAATIKMNEWRFVVSNEGRIITGSQYRENGEAEIHTGWTNAARSKCLEILGEGYHPDPMYTIDICRGSDGNYYLMEIGSFCCSALYGGELPAIIKEGALLAEKEYKDIYNS